MFDTLSDKLQGALGDLRGRGVLTEEDLSRAAREIRLALLEADVNFKVVKAFVDRVRDRALGQDVLRSLSPSQQVVKIVRDEMVELAKERQKKTGVKLLWGTANLFGHPRYMNGAGTNPDFAVVAHAAAQVKAALGGVPATLRAQRARAQHLPRGSDRAGKNSLH